jgi:hypothetical protein
MAKQTMGKDDNGVFHPGKGKPSGANKEEGLGIQATEPEKMDEYLEITEKYTIGEDELDPSVPVRHPNRNTSKTAEIGKSKEFVEESNKTLEQRFTEERTTAEIEELPGTLSRELFKDLANYQSDCCVTIYLGTHSAGQEVNDHVDAINFKNHLQEAETKLKAKGFGEDVVKTLLKPGYDLIRQEEFWMAQSPGLAVFIAKDYFKYIRMQQPACEQCLVIEPTFYVTPLVDLIMRNEYFYLLVISKKTVKLFRVDSYGINIVNVDLPQGIEQVKRLSDLDATTFRSGSSGSRAPAASQEGSYHGTGGGNPDGKDNLLVYFEAVDDILFKEIFNKENVPLVLAGVEYEIPIYRSACDYHNVWPEALTGSREYQDNASLYKDAMELMKPYFEQSVTRAINLFMNNIATPKTSSMAPKVIPAAYYSQISHLFVAKGEHIWGTFDEMSNELVLHDGPDQDGEDLIDNVVVKTLANGGEVYLLDKEKMPVEAQVAAVLRY